MHNLRFEMTLDDDFNHSSFDQNLKLIITNPKNQLVEFFSELSETELKDGFHNWPLEIKQLILKYTLE